MSADSASHDTWRRLWSGTGAPDSWAHRTPDIRRLQALAATLQTLQGGVDADGLTPSQRLAVHWAVSCIADYRVSLIADATGSGKTHVALATARALGLPTAVVCPRPLVAGWKATASHMQVPIRVLSWGQLRRVAEHETPWVGLAILDEAHHLRNPASGVSQAALKWLPSARTLLLSATPVFNDLHEGEHLLGITLSSALAPPRANVNTHESHETKRAQTPRRIASWPITMPISLPSTHMNDWLDHFLLHRTPTQQRQFDRAAEYLGVCTQTGPGDWSGRPRTLHSVVPEHDAGTAAALLMVSRVAASLSGDAGGAWLHRTLLRRMASSTSALLASLRALRGYVDAGRRAALEGRRLQRRDYRQWMQVQEPGAAEQQVLALFLDEAGSSDGFTWNDALRVMDEALLHAWPKNEPTMRHVMERYVRGAAVVFTEYRATARSWFDTIRAEGIPVTRITGDAAYDSQWGRLDMEQALDVFARGRSGKRILVTTSVLSEGVNLPMADVVIHADLPWTPARLQQRNGRLDRRGESAPMHIVMLQPPAALDRQARILDTLLQKQAAHRTLDHSVSAPAVSLTSAVDPQQCRPTETDEASVGQQGACAVARAEQHPIPVGGELSLVQSLVSGDELWRWVQVPDMSWVDIAPMLPWCSHGVSAELPAGPDRGMRFNQCRIRGELERVALVLRSSALSWTVPAAVRHRFLKQRQQSEQRAMLRREGRRELLAMAHRLGARAAVVGDTDCVRWWTRGFVAALGVPPRLNELEVEERWLRTCLLTCDATAPTAELREWVQQRQQFGQQVQKEQCLAFRGPWLVLAGDRETALEQLKRYLDETAAEGSGGSGAERTNARSLHDSLRCSW